jgi:hypothetical protein
MRALRSLIVSGSVAVVAGSLVLATQSAVTTAATPGHPAGQPSARFLAQARAALVSYLSTGRQMPPFRSGGPASKTVNQPAAGPRNASASSSYNWSGYADVSTAANTFTKVSGQWWTPPVKCTAEDQLTSEWVGIDGYNNPTYEQDGTLSWCFQGQPTYFTWYSIYPGATVEVGTSLHAGDRIAASVTRTGSSYKLAVTDISDHANSFSTTQKCTVCKNTSVEWIAERPAYPIGIAPLADYGSWTVSSASETAGGKTGTISTYPTNDAITMVDATGTYQLSVPSGLSAGGDAFYTRWLNSY